MEESRASGDNLTASKRSPLAVPYPFRPLDFGATTTFPLSERANKVQLDDFARPHVAGAPARQLLDSLPNILAGGIVRRIADWWAAAVRDRKVVLFTCGAHVLKVGLTPVLVDLMDRQALSALALNGAGAVHDVEFAMQGQSSEDVAAGIKTGRFGMVRETGEFLNRATARAAREGIGLGESLGRQILQEDLPHRGMSVLAQAYARQVPVTIHVSPGSDIHHSHPGTNGAELGAATFHDFRLLCGIVGELRPGSVVMNIGSAVVLPVTIEKAFAAARNQGLPVEGFLGVNLDFLQHYRANNNPVNRAKELGGEGYSLTGHHEIMVPLLAAAMIERLEAP